MSMTYYEPAAHWSGHLCSTFDQFPHGLVKPPPQVLEQFAKKKVRIAEFLTPDYEKRILDDWTLAYYYEGVFIAYRSVPEGVEVFAVGDEEVGDFVQQMPSDERPDIIFGRP